MFRPIMMIMFLISVGCTSYGNTKSDLQLARFEAYVDTQEVNAPQGHIIRAVQTVLAEHGWTPTEPVAFSGRVVVKGMSRRAAVINARLPDDRAYVADAGCRVDIFPSARAHTLRVTCHGQRSVASTAVGTALPQRVEWQDRYLAAHIIEHVSPAQGKRIWRFEPTGQRAYRCAQSAARGARMPPTCIQPAAPLGAVR